MTPHWLCTALKKLDKRGILAVSAREVLDAAGVPTVEATVTTNRGKFSATVPGIPQPHDPRDADPLAAVEVRDGIPKKGTPRWGGKGVAIAISNIEEKLGPAITGLDPTDQQAVDDALLAADGTTNKKALGANAILAVSMAVARAGASANEVPLYQHLADLGGHEEVIMPLPHFTMIEGGAGAAGGTMPYQQVLLLPTGAANVREAVEVGVSVFNALGEVLEEKWPGSSSVRGVNGGYAPPELAELDDALEMLTTACEKCVVTDKVKYALDAAANRFVVRPPLPEEGEEGEEKKEEEAKGDDDEDEAKEEEDRTYDLGYKREGDTTGDAITGEDFSKLYAELVSKHPIVSIEDPFAKGDWKSFVDLTGTIGGDVQVVGNEALSSQPPNIEECEDKKGANAVVVHMTQLGTVMESIQAVKAAQEVNWGVAVSDRVVETSDSFAADLSVAMRAGQFKGGAPRGLDRLNKLNRLFAIEDELGERAAYVGTSFRRPPVA